MKRVFLIVGGLLIITVLITSSCATTQMSVGPSVPGQFISSCITCHSDSDLLKAVAEEPEKEVSEVTSGEG